MPEYVSICSSKNAAVVVVASTLISAKWLFDGQRQPTRGMLGKRKTRGWSCVEHATTTKSAATCLRFSTSTGHEESDEPPHPCDRKRRGRSTYILGFCKCLHHFGVPEQREPINLGWKAVAGRVRASNRKAHQGLESCRDSLGRVQKEGSE